MKIRYKILLTIIIILLVLSLVIGVYYFLIKDNLSNKNQDKIEFTLYPATVSCDTKQVFRYVNEDGNLYDIYYSCINRLALKKDSDTFYNLDVMLRGSEVSMSEIVQFLEEKVKSSDAIKEDSDDGGSKLYRYDDFSLLQCNTLDGNKDIYIGDYEMKFESYFCQNSSD